MEEENGESILEDLAIPVKRRSLLPWWMKIFCWICMLFGAAALFCVVARVFRIYPEIEFFGLRTNDPFSIVGMILCAVIIFKGVTAGALWFEKNDAIKLGMIDAIIGIMLSLVVMMVLPYTIEGFPTNFRAELLLLIPYLVRLDKIKKRWEGRVTVLE